MDLIGKTKEIIKKHNLTEKLTFNPFKVRRESKIGFNSFSQFQGSYEKETELQIRYFNKVPDGYYGFDVACMPLNWLEALDEFLLELEKESPNFKIFNLKLKLGGLRFYADNVSENAKRCIALLEKVMCDKNLIY